MPQMDICKTNFITGAYLSGLSFNQIPCVDQSFKNNTKNIFSWLLRVFFSASIGFQVSLMLYGDPTVIVCRFAFYLAVLGKIPTGLFVPKSKRSKAVSLNRYWRDFIIAGVAMTCHGELFFFITTYALASGLVSRQMYASAIWAAFQSSITSPIALRALIRYYNRLSKVYIESPMATVEGKADKIPMYWAIEVQMAVIPGFYDHLSFAMNDVGLTIINKNPGPQQPWKPRLSRRSLLKIINIL
jgi:Kef-type K+ transport system membrane component KefB